MPLRKPKSCPHRTRFGKNIASLRRRQELTQEKLAEKVGASARYIQSVEAGESLSRVCQRLSVLHAALDCDWEDLFAGCDKR